LKLPVRATASNTRSWFSVIRPGWERARSLSSRRILLARLQRARWPCWRHGNLAPEAAPDVVAVPAPRPRPGARRRRPRLADLGRRRNLLEDERGPSAQGVAAQQRVRLLGALQREGAADHRPQAALAEQLERFVGLGQRQGARDADI